MLYLEYIVLAALVVFCLYVCRITLIVWIRKQICPVRL